MNHPIYRVRSFQITAPYTLRVVFDDGVEQTVNFEPVLGGQLYGPLRDLSLFNQVRLDGEVHTLVWPNGADFDPATLHDWPEQVQELTARAANGTSRRRKTPTLHRIYTYANFRSAASPRCRALRSAIQDWSFGRLTKSSSSSRGPGSSTLSAKRRSRSDIIWPGQGRRTTRSVRRAAFDAKPRGAMC